MSDSAHQDFNLDGANVLCDDNNWFKNPRAIFDLYEQGDISKNELLVYLYSFNKANPSNALYTTSHAQISNFLKAKSRTTGKEVLEKLKSKGYLDYDTTQGMHSFKVKVIHYPYRKHDRKGTQMYSKKISKVSNSTPLAIEKCEVAQNDVKLKDYEDVVDSNSFFKLNKSGVKSPE